MLLSRIAFVVSTICLAAFAVPASAVTIVAPGAYAATDAPSGQFAILGNPSNSASTFQFVVAASELGGLTTGAQISAIGFRFAGTPYVDPVGAASYGRYDIQIGRAARTTSTLSSTYTDNMGADTILARSGALTIPAGTFADLPGDGPNPFYDLAFTTPYTYAGGDLAVTLRLTPNSGNPAIPVDAFTPDARINTVFTFGSATATTGTVGSGFAPVTRFTFAPAAPVPEPASWAMMVGGFGLVGGALRRRRLAVRFA